VDSFDHKDLEELIERKGFPCVSIFMPTFRAGKEVQQNSIRFKNLLSVTAQKLADSGVETTDIDQLIGPATSLLENQHFWRHQADGLGVFADAEMFRVYRLPVHFEELVVVTDRFHVKPLVSLLAHNREFYVLALSQKAFRLIQCTRHGARTIPVKGAPESIFEATRVADAEKQLQFHTGARAGGGRRDALFHGTGAAAGNPDMKKAILKYFQGIDRGIAAPLRGKHVPLVVAAVDYLIPLYKEANSYPHLVEEGVTGNPEAVAAEELRDQALVILEPEFRRTRAAAAAKYNELRGTGLASADLETVVVAAHRSRVHTLFVPVGANRWGRYDPGSASVEIHENEEPGDQDLLDLAAVQSLAHGARVFATAPDEMPGGGEVAAVFRF
jgi:hypothetical protein